MDGLSLCQQSLDFDMRQNLHAEGIDDRVDLEAADLPKLPMVEESFDVVVSSFALHRLPHSKKGVREMVRVLRKGGKVGIVDTSHIGEYRREFERLGLTCTQHGPSWRMFPPVTTLIGRKL